MWVGPEGHLHHIGAGMVILILLRSTLPMSMGNVNSGAHLAPVHVGGDKNNGATGGTK